MKYSTAEYNKFIFSSEISTLFQSLNQPSLADIINGVKMEAIEIKMPAVINVIDIKIMDFLTKPNDFKGIRFTDLMEMINPENPVIVIPVYNVINDYDTFTYDVFNNASIILERCEQLSMNNVSVPFDMTSSSYLTLNNYFSYMKSEVCIRKDEELREVQFKPSIFSTGLGGYQMI